MEEPVYQMTDHAVERFVQRLSDCGDLSECFARAVEVSKRQLNHEANVTGRKPRFEVSVRYLRDDTTGALFVCKKAGSTWLVLTCYRFRRPVWSKGKGRS